MSWKKPQSSPWAGTGGVRSKKRWPRWTREIRIGDVLSNGRSNRVVRDVNYDRHGELRSVCFVIKHCSWTGRCTTTLSRYDLMYAGYGPTGVRRRLDTELDAQIHRDLCYSNRADPKLDCCDVKGVP